MFVFTWQDNQSDLSGRTVSFAQISKEVSLKRSIHCYFRIPHAAGILCQRCDSCVFQSRCWIMAAKKAEKTSWQKFPMTQIVNAQSSSKQRIKNSKSTFFTKKAWGEVPVRAICWDRRCKMAAKIRSPSLILVFYILSSTGKLYITIDRGNARQEGEDSRVLCWNEQCRQQLRWRQP